MNQCHPNLKRQNFNNNRPWFFEGGITILLRRRTIYKTHYILNYKYEFVNLEPYRNFSLVSQEKIESAPKHLSRRPYPKKDQEPEIQAIYFRNIITKGIKTFVIFSTVYIIHFYTHIILHTQTCIQNRSTYLLSSFNIYVRVFFVSFLLCVPNRCTMFWIILNNFITD